jgi:hypothetical protein
MNDELQQELAALAAKLGVSVEHLWGVHGLFLRGGGRWSALVFLSPAAEIQADG